VVTLLAGFDSIDAAGGAVSSIIGSGIVPAAVEMMDRLTIDAAEAAVHPDFRATAVLIVELDGPRVEVDELLRWSNRSVRGAGARSRWKSRATMRRARGSGRAQGGVRRDGTGVAELYVQDGVVRARSCRKCCGGFASSRRGRGCASATCFHAGDGNLHPLICYDESIPGQAEHAEQVASEILHYCIDAGGALTGEHGVGVDKKASMRRCSVRTISTRCSSCGARSIRRASAIRARCSRRRACAAMVPARTGRHRSSAPDCRALLMSCRPRAQELSDLAGTPRAMLAAREQPSGQYRTRFAARRATARLSHAGHGPHRSRPDIVVRRHLVARRLDLIVRRPDFRSGYPPEPRVSVLRTSLPHCT
jgi:hypothetical protein